MQPQSKNSTIKATNSSATKAGKEAIKLLRNWPGKHNVAVGLSGGVDSSLTAALLIEAGWDVEGLTLWIMSGKGSCCSEGLIDAAGICEQLGITHHIVDTRSKFNEEIVERLINGYQEGLTPLPCSRCNRSVKFSTMLNWAKEKRQIDLLATGHYARIRHKEDIINEYPAQNKRLKKYNLLRGLDKNKDQSYFLYDLPQEVLSKVIFPLGELTKSDTRYEALKYNLSTAKKPESQDLCLAEHHGSMKAFLDNYIKPKQGDIVLKDGTFLGKHYGIQNFTIGQRKGLGVSWREPLHVVKIDSESNLIVVAPRSDSGQSDCIVGKVNWASILPPEEQINVEVQIRYRSNPVKAKLTPITPTDIDIADGRPYRCQLIFKEKQFSITPGQAAVFYAGELLLGGGIIEKRQTNQ